MRKDDSQFTDPDGGSSIQQVERLFGLNPMELRVVEALLHKAPKENRTETARKLGMSRRTLYEYERNPKILDAIQESVVDQMKLAYLDVMGGVVRKSSAGNMTGAGVFLKEYARICDIENKFKRELARQHKAFVKAIGKESIETQERIIREYKNNLLSA